MKRQTIFYGIKDKQGHYVSQIKTSNYGEEVVSYPCITEAIIDAERFPSFEEAKLMLKVLPEGYKIFTFKVNCIAEEV